MLEIKSKRFEKYLVTMLNLDYVFRGTKDGHTY